jgi:hypothetical protein
MLAYSAILPLWRVFINETGVGVEVISNMEITSTL